MSSISYVWNRAHLNLEVSALSDINMAADKALV